MEESASHHVKESVHHFILRGSASEKLIWNGLWASNSMVFIKNQLFQKILMSSFLFPVGDFELTPDLLEIVSRTSKYKEKCI